MSGVATGEVQSKLHQKVDACWWTGESELDCYLRIYTWYHHLAILRILLIVISWYTSDHQLVILIISPKIKFTCRNSPAESSVARCPYIVWKTFCCRVVWWDIKRSKNHRNCERCLSISYYPGLKCHLDLYCPEGIEYLEDIERLQSFQYLKIWIRNVMNVSKRLKVEGWIHSNRGLGNALRFIFVTWQKSSASAQLIGEAVCRNARSDFCKYQLETCVAGINHVWTPHQNFEEKKTNQWAIPWIGH